MATVSSDLNAVEGPCLPIRRLLLLGFQGSGKTSTLNTILSQVKTPPDHSQTEQHQHCVEILKWRLLLIDTPGWQLETGDTTDEGHSENQQFITDQCSPGPHAVLLVVPIGTPFTEHHWQGLWCRVRALGAGIWRHTMVLFTCLDQLSQDKGVEEFIVDGGAALQRLVERCGCRYHTLDNTCSDNGTQVAELLQKVEEIVQENQGWFFEMEKPNLMFEDEEFQEEREGDGVAEVEKTPAMFRSPPRELRLLLVGWRGAGKSSAGNVLLGCRVFESGRPTEVSVRRQAFVAGRRLTIVDTPGWDWFSVQRTPSNVRKEIRQGAGLLHPGPHALLLVIPVVSTLTPKKRQALKSHLEMFSEEACLHTLVLFSCGDWLYGTSIEDHIQQNGGELLKLMKHCWNCYHVLDCTKANQDRTQVTELLQKIEEMVAENGQKPFLPVKLNQELDEEETSGRCIMQ
ncbi:GTPase IMAP family member 8-like isoform X1 [Myxocyprinus asiaticus]|uniref:GTPase IMAP family member 8-like isoform X1 n=1 Tax=Myxocyprinus asiaticus TaxID=70543 RepID=UPI002221FFD2|nr:GTPase IMAP family member 8-like isoform X1 [Myxocyprinus asiaticus]